MISLITIGTILNYLTRATLGVAAPTLTGELGIAEKEYSWITGVFQIGIMLQPIAGYVMDVIGLKLGFGLFAIAWAVITMLHGAAINWQMLAGLRGLMGFAEGSAQPGGMKAVAEWFPAKERGFAGGFYNIGASFGSMLAAPLVAWAILFHSWRLAFVIAGGLGAGVGGRCGSASITRRSSIRSCRRRNVNTSSPVRRRTWPARRPSRPCSACSSSAMSGASRYRACSPIRPGAHCPSGCRSI